MVRVRDPSSSLDILSSLRVIFRAVWSYSEDLSYTREALRLSGVKGRFLRIRICLRWDDRWASVGSKVSDPPGDVLYPAGVLRSNSRKAGIRHSDFALPVLKHGPRSLTRVQGLGC